MSTSTRLPPEGNRQADRNNNSILANTEGYHNLLLLELSSWLYGMTYFWLLG